MTILVKVDEISDLDFPLQRGALIVQASAPHHAALALTWCLRLEHYVTEDEETAERARHMDCPTEREIHVGVCFK